MAGTQRQPASLFQSEELFHLMVESAKDYAIFALDTEGRVTSWNTGVERVLGYDEVEFTGQHFSCIFTPEDIETSEPEKELQTAAAEGQADNERWHVRKDGTRFWATGTVTPLQDKTRRLHGFAIVMRDNTESRMAE